MRLALQSDSSSSIEPSQGAVEHHPTASRASREVHTIETAKQRSWWRPTRHKSDQTVAEELANALTHGLGIVMAAVGGAWLLWFAYNTYAFAAVGVYIASMLAVYIASTASHTFVEPKRRHFWRCLDQASIYLFIVGTCTPLTIIYLHDIPARVGLGLMWTIAAAGFISKMFFSHQINAVSKSLYVALGWMPVILAPHAAWTLPWEVGSLVVLGGLLYTAGAVVLAYDDRRKFLHTGWHLMVMSASICHFIAISLAVWGIK